MTSARVRPSDAQCLLFVYGSLRRGLENHRELGPARFLGEMQTAPHFALRVLSGYPVLVAGSRAVGGELFEMPARHLTMLDAFEGPPYVRHEIELADGRRALAYLARDEAAGVAYEADCWPDPSSGSKIGA